MSIYLQELIPQMRFNRWDYVRALRALLPRGVPWNIPLPDEIDIRPFSIFTSEAFGRVTISTGQTFITPNGIQSEESFGNLYVATEIQLSLSGISSLEIFGTPSIGIGISLNGNGIVSEELWGNPSISGWTQFSDFESGLGSGWDSEFTTDWTQETEDGEGIAQRASDGDDRLYPPSGSLLAGDLIVEWGFWRSSPQVGNTSVHMRLLDSSDVAEADAGYSGGNIAGINGGSFSAPSGPSEQRMKIVRSSGTIWCYRWTGSAWEREDAWSTPGSSVSNSEDLYLQVNGADGMNGFTYIGISGTTT